ncbi:MULTISPECIES: DUF3800 domain-containing protein [Proteus]|uniref:DUF3800 domain-containing protein n=1 Tax=Proteus appendicitidis TaxID=3034648 RepID=A0ABY8YCH9_9GAMM|nr:MULTISPECIES: DUF3800 domain-containing protein [Proteus]AVB30087.1 hypothetical protein C3940_07895 [Proteus mirabilis]MCT0069496.1 DUF3800 domain-containing protein [Proteus mirabilis]MCU9570530.1 DUF3800 domain-containing protein [Proteus mirabilis]QTR58705.1 DUF3800 domain-containing protein [Proteus mirabilis]WIV89814.1 DUF3800 domain-containing protein [Proteus sp. HZ0627]
MSIFSIDESGYTGRDLLQKSQPWQGASAVKISHDDALYLIKQHFPKRKAPELKFSSLKKRDSYQKPIFTLQQELLANFPCVTCIADKRFILVQLFIEYAVEPFYYANGINLYENGGNVSMASMAYYVCKAYFGNDFENILLSFQNAMYEKTHAAVKTLIKSVKAVDWWLLPEVLGPLAQEHPDCIEAIINPSTSTDAAFIILQALISRTELMSEGPYGIEHDRSKNLLQYNDYLSMLIKCQIPAEFKMSEIASIRYPLKLKSVKQVDSKLSPAVQLCDVLIGSAISGVRDLLHGKPTPIYSPLKLYEGNQLIHFTPNIDFKEQKKFRNNGQGNEYIDFIADQFNKFGG